MNYEAFKQFFKHCLIITYKECGEKTRKSTEKQTFVYNTGSLQGSSLRISRYFVKAITLPNAIAFLIFNFHSFRGVLKRQRLNGFPPTETRSQQKTASSSTLSGTSTQTTGFSLSSNTSPPMSERSSTCRC